MLCPNHLSIVESNCLLAVSVVYFITLKSNHPFEFSEFQKHFYVC